ncbi:MAG: hypothetical protein JEY91_15025 [Spirochaetaceae bacterium]|nr:hypothetical protein [Spirochaetaceae bacterium]
MSALEGDSDIFSKDNKSPRIHFFFQATLQLGIRDAKLNLQWVEELIEHIKNGTIPAL